MRFWIYGHVAAVIGCAIFSIADQHGVLAEPTSTWASVALNAIFWPSLFAIYVCPLAVLILLLSHRRPWGQVVTCLLAETLLTFGHLFALMPAIH